MNGGKDSSGGEREEVCGNEKERRRRETDIHRYESFQWMLCLSSVGLVLQACPDRTCPPLYWNQIHADGKSAFGTLV